MPLISNYNFFGFLFINPIACSRYLKSRLVQYISKTKKQERALKTKDVLLTSLAEKLDVMREEKTSRETGYATNDMNSKRVSEHSQPGDECNGYSSSNETDSNREQARNFQNEGSKDKTDVSVNGSVICSNEAQQLKMKFENVEKELTMVKDDLGKVSKEKSQVFLN